MIREGLLKSMIGPNTAPSFVKELTVDEKAAFEPMEVLDIDLESAQWLQTIGEGWAWPLNRFMNEIELLECMHLNTVTDRNTGERHMLSVPITLPVDTKDKLRMEGKPKVALKCS